MSNAYERLAVVRATALVLFLAASLPHAASAQTASTHATAAQTASPVRVRLDHALAPTGGALRAMPPARTGAGDPAIASSMPARTRALPDTVRVLALMVEFQADTDTRTSGTGKFGTVYPQDYGSEIIDPLPHDRAYFEAHLRFLENYVAKASGGRTTVVGRVLGAPVTVSKTIRDYSPRKGEIETPVAQLVVEAWTLADAAFAGEDFSQYDMFVLYHASRGRDVDLASILGADPTPFDIPSLAFTHTSLRRLLGADFAGVPMMGGRFHIRNTAVLPSTNVREIPLLTGGAGLLELTTNGLLAASFGTWAGLPDLFDTKKGVTGIGRFGLMDPESIFAYGGIAPPAPSAWEMTALGWAQPREASAGRRQYFLTAQRSDQPSTADIIRVPVTAREYWLVENRQRDPGGNGQRITMRSAGQDLDLRFAKDTTGFENGSIALLKGVVTDVEDLDWSLPGGTVVTDKTEQRVNGGILIWHVDEEVIRRGLADNTVNADPALRGVDLEQAGGAQDIGRSIPSIFGATIGSGSPVDYWFDGNIAPLYENSFSMLTNPNTRANSGAYSHVTIDRFGAPGPLMSLEIALGDNTLAPVAGWPVDLSPVLGSDSARMRVQTADLDGDGAHEVLVAAETAADGAVLVVLRADGSPYLAGTDAPVVLRDRLARRVVSAALAGDVTGDGVPELVLVTADESTTRVHVATARDADTDGQLDLVHVLAHASSSFGDAAGAQASAFMISDGALRYQLVGSRVDTVMAVTGTVARTTIEAGRQGLRAIAASGTPGVVAVTTAMDAADFIDVAGGMVTPGRTGLTVRSHPNTSGPFQIVTADFDGDGRFESVAPAGQGIGVFAPTSDGRATFFDDVKCGMFTLTGAHRAMGAGDVDGDGRMDLLVADSTRVSVLNGVFASVDDHPFRTTATQVFAVRLAGDARDAVFAAGDGQLAQLGSRARQAEGFPVPLPRGADVVLAPLGVQSPTLGVVAAGDGGRVFLFDTKSRLAASGLRWRAQYGDETQRGMPLAAGDAVVTSDVFFPPERCYNWPNPVYDKRTAIRLYVSHDADVRVKILDLAGALVAELAGRAVGGMDNELSWDASAVQSGIYMAKVEATAPGRSGEKIIKIAIVR